jgi:hypothetical protein
MAEWAVRSDRKESFQQKGETNGDYDREAYQQDPTRK